MKRLVLFLISAAALVAFTATEVSAKPRVGNRQIRQQKRIRQGVKSGSLTKNEVKKLEKQQARIQRTKRRMRSDGKVTVKERVKLERMQDKASRQICKEKHDRQTRQRNIKKWFKKNHK